MIVKRLELQRLTKKVENYDKNYGYYDLNLTEDQVEDTQKVFGACIEKLGKLEDIEEELGIDLLTLIKALTEQIYIRAKTEEGKEIYVKCNGKWNFINKERKCFDTYIDPHQRKFYFDDYGSVWALTEEELKKQM